MSIETIVATWLADATITALVGDRRALSQLPQNSTFPALVYQVVDMTPQPIVAYQTTAQRARARVQLNPLAGTIAEVQAIHAALRALLDFKHNVVVAGKTIVTSRLELLGPTDKDNDAGVWTQPADYMITWVE